ncbi:PaaI family thioesterase [Antrihabitans cavernicola]|uniref:PaaI family thioesterase n=1 Tax=Antrihabitans cavernicola TaxID=2495913 RepID=A0A5A7S5F0_9NOCA|nr:PaaI family thioesterase [Spelaeibacter cavernicola]KAA0021408.1 PaaI family thioesterase [Spelaeibacter cavernicola]
MTVFDEFPMPPCAQLLGWSLAEHNPETGWVKVGFDAGPQFCNPGGTVQGGFLAAMLDDTLGPTILVKSQGSHYCATIDLSVSFIAPALPGRLVGEGRIVRAGKTIAFLAGELRNAAGDIVATATASARVVPTAGLVLAPKAD